LLWKGLYKMQIFFNNNIVKLSTLRWYGES
jgi:hypothetical protein